MPLLLPPILDDSCWSLRLLLLLLVLLLNTGCAVILEPSGLSVPRSTEVFEARRE